MKSNLTLLDRMFGVTGPLTPEEEADMKLFDERMRANLGTVGERLQADMDNIFASTANTTGAPPENGLTLAKIREAMSALPPPPEEPLGVDLAGSPLISQAYEIKAEFTPLWPHLKRHRRFVVVPKAELEKWHLALLKAGVDVRVMTTPEEPL